MKKIAFLFMIVFVLSAFGFKPNADTVSYKFDSIKITSAYKFTVTVTELPNENSFLYNQVKAGETLSVYVGTLEFVNNNVTSDGGYILILTDEEGHDLVKWLANGYMTDKDASDISFSSHIQIDPNYGVIKTPDEGVLTADVLISNESIYKLKDNTGSTYSMNAGSLEVQNDVNLVISAYNGE